MINITKNNSKNTEENVKKNDSENSTEQEITTETKSIAKTETTQINELTDTLKRLQAEFENYKKRVDKDNVATIKNANTKLVISLLPVLDSFELALKNNDNENPEIAKYRKGLELIYSQLYSILEGYGLRIIDTKNKKFDPFRHEVLLVKECDSSDDMILQEFQKGYFLNDTIIRHSRVMIAKHVEENK